MRLLLDTHIWLWASLEPGRLAASARAVDLRDAPLSAPVVAAADRVRVAHRDPIDWLLAATARHYDLALVTLDRHLLAGSGFARLGPPG